MNQATIDDGFSHELVAHATFDGEWEIPIIKSREIIVPNDIVPFDKRRLIPSELRKEYFIHFYIYDIKFKSVIKNAEKYIEEFREFGGVISPDCSTYIDAPLATQLGNTYMNRAIGSYIQNRGIPVIPNVRWGDERTFQFAFDGLEKRGIYAISTHGCIKTNEDKQRFKEGLEEMIVRLEPKKVLLHGRQSECIFEDFREVTEFIHYKSWIERVKEGGAHGNK